MGKTIAIMFTFTTYGTWLRGDIRGWVNKGTIYPADPGLVEMDIRKLKHKPYYFQKANFDRIAELIHHTANKFNVSIYALTIKKWHIHLVTSALPCEIGRFVLSLKTSIRAGLGEKGKIWSHKYDKRFCFNLEDSHARIRYVQKHNIEDGLDANPWDFIESF